MSGNPQETIDARHFFRRHLGRILVGVLLVLMLYGVMVAVLPYSRERLIARRVKNLGGKVIYADTWPDWIPRYGAYRVTLGDRLCYVYGLQGQTIPSELIDELSALKNLERLDLSRSNATDEDLQRLARSTSLRWLNLGKTKVTDRGMEFLKEMTSLRQLYLRETQIGDAGLGHLVTLTNLGEIYLSKTRVTDEGLAQLSGLENFRVVCVDHTQIGDVGLRHLSLGKAGDINVSGTRVTDAGLEHLKRSNRSYIISLIDTETTVEGRTSLRKTLPRCLIYPQP